MRNMNMPSRELTTEDLELGALDHARASGAREFATIVAVGNCGRGPVGPCGRDRQILFDYHPKIRVILPTPDGVRSVRISDLMPLGAVWTPDEGTQEFNPAIFEDASDTARGKLTNSAP
jgi:hypothetical protein